MRRRGPHDGVSAKNGKLQRMNGPEKATKYSDKFVAFIDIIGFSRMIEESERGNGFSLDEIIEITSILSSTQNVDQIREYGPTVCPESYKISRDIDIQITQISDCSITSSEVSPASAINILDNCLRVSARLMLKGILCRGFITRGSIYHRGNHVFGTAYQRAVKEEQEVLAFSGGESDTGTPFIQIDSSVLNYIQESCDDCVKLIFDRISFSDGKFSAISPFRILNPYASIGSSPFSLADELRNVDIVRGQISKTISSINSTIVPQSKRAEDKRNHYISMLEAQLDLCGRAESQLRMLAQPYGRVATKERFPGLFRDSAPS